MLLTLILLVLVGGFKQPTHDHNHAVGNPPRYIRLY